MYTKGLGCEVNSRPQTNDLQAKTLIGKFMHSEESRVAWFFEEILYRCRLVISAPTRQQALKNEREAAHSQQHELAEEYSKGYLEGWHDCYAACLAAIEEEASRKNEIWTAGDMLVCPEGSLKN